MVLRQRMKSIKNIEKITKAMKMVASSRMRKAQVRDVCILIMYTRPAMDGCESNIIKFCCKVIFI